MNKTLTALDVTDQIVEGGEIGPVGAAGMLLVNGV